MPAHKLSEFFIRHRVKWWARQSLQARHELNERARQHQAEKLAEAREEHQHLEDQIKELLDEQREAAEHHAHVCMSESAVTSLDLEHFQRLVSDPQYSSPSRVAMLRCDVTAAPPPLTVPGSDTAEVWCRREPSMPSWCKEIGKYREFFQDCAFVCKGEGNNLEYWKLIYVVQSPSLYVAVCKMMPTVYSCPPLGGGASAQDWTSSNVSLAWTCNFGVMKTAADMPVTSIEQLQVVFGLVHRGGTIVTAAEHPVAVRSFLWGSDTRARAEPEAGAEKPVKSAEYEEILEKFPWLIHLDATDSFVRNAEIAIKKAGSSADSAEMPEIVVDDDFIMDALSRVERARIAEAAVAAERGTSDFLAKECQGESNLLRGAEFHDAVQGVAATKYCAQWARDRKLQITWKATFTEHTEAASRTMVRAWCHRMQYFFDLEMADASPDFCFTPAMVAAYQEPSELSELARATTKGTTLKRIALIRKIPM